MAKNRAINKARNHKYLKVVPVKFYGSNMFKVIVKATGLEAWESFYYTRGATSQTLTGKAQQWENENINNFFEKIVLNNE